MNARPTTIMFLDLSRFTALNDIHGDETAVGVLDQFTDAVRAATAGAGRVVKTLGDGVLLACPDPAAAISVADATSHRLHDLADMPELTGGITTGTVIERDGDVLGTTVNLAARLADLAPSGELRVDETTARAASTAGWQVEPLGPVEIRGFHEPVTVFGLLLCHPTDCVTDPVCGMRLTPGSNTPQVAHNGATVWFCSPSCQQRFKASPDRYLHPT